MKSLDLKDKLITLIPAWVLACMMSAIALKAALLPELFSLILLATLISFALMFFLTINSKTTLAGIGIIIISLLFMWILIGEDGRERILEFISLSVEYFTVFEDLQDKTSVILSFLIVFLISIICFIFGWRLSIFPVILIITLGSIITVWEIGHKDILFYSSGALFALIIMYAVSFQGFLNRKYKTKTDKSSMTMWTIPIAVIIILFGFLFSFNPFKTTSKWFYKTTNEINDFLADYTGFTTGRTYFSISAWGLMPLDDRLGGPVELNDIEVLKIDSTSRELLRAKIYNSYTGYSWEDTVRVNGYRFNQKRYEELQDDTFDNNRPVFKDDMTLGRYEYSFEMHVEPLINMSSSLYIPFRITDIVPDRMIYMVPYFDTKGELYSARDIKNGVGYSISSTLINYKDANFPKFIDGIRDSVIKDSKKKTKFIIDNYTQLPDSLPQEVIIIAEDITKGIDGDYAKIIALKEYLKSTCTYTFTPSLPPEDRDFVGYFLETKEGYCTYYASALAVMARVIGVPSRYVEGYAMPRNKTNGYYIVTGEYAHAWVEVYLDSIGWIPVDATTLSGLPSDYVQNSGSALDDYIDPYLEEEGMDSQLGDLEFENEAVDNSQMIRLVRLTALYFAVTSLILLLIINPILRRFRKSLYSLKRRYNKDIEIISFYFDEILRLLTYYNTQFPVGKTLQSFTQKVDEWLVTEGDIKFIDVADMISQISYNAKEVTDDDIRMILRYRIILSKATRKIMGNARYYYSEGLGIRSKKK